MTPEMTRTEKQRNRLVALLKKLFQLDQPDLDFGFYKIMHAQAKTVSDFMENDLLEIIQKTFGEADEEKIKETHREYEKALEQAKSFGAPDPEATEPVKQAKAAYETAQKTGTNEGEIYEHLYRFFERYYDEGDFMSRRYFARETRGKAAPYAVPYEGQEVYLHWANRDQYYIKTSEHLANFTFDIAKHASTAPLLPSPPSLKLHCRIVDAAEGEHNNNKTTDKTERFFLLHKHQPVLMEQGELVLQFEYRPDKEKSGTASKWQEQRMDEAQSTLFHALEGMDEAASYRSALAEQIDAEKDPRPLLRKYLNQYTKRNTTDYFIHKDLGSFLSRELDFYIKNEIMRLDDIESAHVPRVEDYLEKIKALRKIAAQLIAFLAQLEDFQKKLWLKKKFVTETHYCFTLDRIPETFYAEIAANEAQRQEWITLFAIDQIQGDLTTPPYGQPLTVDFLKANPFLVLDTAFFPKEFKERLVAEIQNLDETLEGLLIHSENFQALGLMQEKYKEQVKCVYIDPPYNAQSSEILYKNTYKHSSWLSLMQDRIDSSKNVLRADFVYVCAIDEIENLKLGLLHAIIFPNDELDIVSIVHNPTGQQGDGFSYTHDFAHFIHPSGNAKLGLENRDDTLRQSQPDIRPLRNVSSGQNHLRESATNCFYPIFVKDGKIIGFGDVCADNFHPEKINIKRADGIIEIYPIDSSNIESKWVFARDTVESIASELTAKYNEKKDIWDVIREKTKFRYKSLWSDKRYNANSWGSAVLNKILPENPFSYPKSIFTVSDCIDCSLNNHDQGIVLDYFAGSGTTGHAVVNLNREDGGKRKYILVEMGNYFETVTKPRMQKVVYSPDWKEGKPVSRQGISHAFKYIRLESYEDTLNNLYFKEDEAREKVLEDNAMFRRDYMLKYWLEFATKESPSLLNIEQFVDPTAYMLQLKKPASDEYEEKAVDLVETFNWLIGLHVEHLDQWRRFRASFKREHDPTLPQDEATRLILDGRMNEAEEGPWWFRKVEGRTCRTPGDMNHTERVLVIWRKLTGNLEEDNLMLDEWFKKYRLSTQDSEFDVIYVNGSNNLPNIQKPNEHWKVRLMEEVFHQKMWDGEG